MARKARVEPLFFVLGFFALLMVLRFMYALRYDYKPAARVSPAVSLPTPPPPPPTPPPTKLIPTAAPQTPIPTPSRPPTPPTWHIRKTEQPLPTHLLPPDSSTALGSQCFAKTPLFPRSQITNLPFQKMYIIHWNKMPDRRVEMTRRLNASFPPDWQEKNLVSFVDTEFFEEEVVACISGEYAAGLARGRFSVTAKHFLAYHDMLSHRYDVILIVEDDADFKPDFWNKSKLVRSSLPANWSNAMLSCDPSACCPRCKPCTSLICPAPTSIGSCCAFGYLVSSLGAWQMISHMPVRNTPDWQMDWVAGMDSSFKTYLMNDYPIFEKAIGKDMVWYLDPENRARPALPSATFPPTPGG